MRYSQMTPEQRAALFDDPSRYPFHVDFLGKYAVLTEVEIALLRQQGIDFDVDDAEVAAVLGPGEVAVAATRAEGRTGLLWAFLGAVWAILRSAATANFRRRR